MESSSDRLSSNRVMSMTQFILRPEGYRKPFWPSLRTSRTAPVSGASTTHPQLMASKSSEGNIKEISLQRCSEETHNRSR